MRAIPGLPSLRSKNVFAALRDAIAAGSRQTFRVVEFSVQSNHVHMLVESSGLIALARGMQGLAARLAKAINRLAGRRGSVWRDRYHARALETPREVRHALAYVLLNVRKHSAGRTGVDPCSSGPWFTGWRESVTPARNRPPVVRARTWLLSVGWRQWGRISTLEVPRRRSRPG